jgi:uncharacterized membrane protein YbaN (DUF454 family)
MAKNLFLRWILIISGILSMIVAVIGIFLPLIPTTPLLLLSAACFAKSSDRFYKWLINNKYLGSFIRNYRERHGVHFKIKAVAMTLMWAAIIYSAFFVINILIIKIILIIIAVVVTIHLIRIKTLYD